VSLVINYNFALKKSPTDALYSCWSYEPSEEEEGEQDENLKGKKKENKTRKVKLLR